MTKKEAAALIAIITATMPNLQDKKLAAAAASWAVLMPDVNFDEGKAAVIKLLRERKIATLPLPGEILDTVHKLRTERVDCPTAYEAWEEVCSKLSLYTATEWSHPLIGKAVHQTGVHAILQGSWGVAERFFKVYNTLAEREKNKVEIAIVTSIAQRFDMDMALGLNILDKPKVEQTRTTPLALDDYAVCRKWA